MACYLTRRHACLDHRIGAILLACCTAWNTSLHSTPQQLLVNIGVMRVERARHGGSVGNACKLLEEVPEGDADSILVILLDCRKTLPEHLGELLPLCAVNERALHLGNARKPYASSSR